MPFYNSANPYYCPIGDKLAVTIVSNYPYLAIQPLYFSRAVLDEPVTKTAQNTMKITYEFTTPQPSSW